MSKDDHIQLTGIVTNNSRDNFIVSADGNSIRAKISGKLRNNKIKVVVGDRVIVGVSPYDMTNGFIIKRL
jgi:translation initiation factor IF-1